MVIERDGERNRPPNPKGINTMNQNTADQARKVQADYNAKLEALIAARAAMMEKFDNMIDELDKEYGDQMNEILDRI